MTVRQLFAYESDSLLPGEEEGDYKYLGLRAGTPLVAATVDGTANLAAEDGTIDVNIRALNSAGKNKIGVHPRYLSLARTLGDAPNQYIVRTKLIILTLALFEATTRSSVVVYNTFTWRVINKYSERVI
jgi:hypothetical protein